MADDSTLQGKSAVSAALSNQVVRSNSEPSMSKSDPMSLYTTAPDGVPPIFILLTQLVMDFLAFFIRGGISTLMFSMDIVLRLFIFVFVTWLQIPGVFVIAYGARFIMWCYQVMMWVTYTSVELVFYLPIPFLIIYLLGLALVYYNLPVELNPVLRSMWWLSQHFLDMLKYLLLNTAT